MIGFDFYKEKCSRPFFQPRLIDDVRTEPAVSDTTDRPGPDRHLRCASVCPSLRGASVRSSSRSASVCLSLRGASV